MTKILLRARHCAKYWTFIISFNNHKNPDPLDNSYYPIAFTNEETSLERLNVSSQSRVSSMTWAELDSGLSDTKPYPLSHSAY